MQPGYNIFKFFLVVLKDIFQDQTKGNNPINAIIKKIVMFIIIYLMCPESIVKYANIITPFC